VNSLALISARYTMKAIEVLSMMCAAALVSVCQALDLRALQSEFQSQFRGLLAHAITELVNDSVCEHVSLADNQAPPEESESADQIGQALLAPVLVAAEKKWESSASLDLQGRAEGAASAAAGALVLEAAKRSSSTASRLLEGIAAWEEGLGNKLIDCYDGCRRHMFENHLSVTPTYLGAASRNMYVYIRKTQGVPFFRGLQDDPLDTAGSGERKSLGTYISRVYEAIRKGKVNETVVMIVAELGGRSSINRVGSARL
jgi:phenylalanine ammonia-lyase